ncbi:MAG: SGNH/GDSL hydrolase family protein [Lachnospiraceae bacterium]|nr:SGNH/GDSL hydrolase family protein [Lachnospiraceae bacterium]
MNKKEILRLILFNLIFIVSLTLLTYVLRTNGDIKDIFSGFYAEKDDTIDVVMIGSSPVYPFYSSPMIFDETGISMYPLSSNVQRPKAMIPLMEETLKTQKPKLFVFETRMFTFEEGRMYENMAFARGVTDNLKYSLNRIKTINRLIPSKSEMEERMSDPLNQDQPKDSYEERYTYYFDIFKYHSNWKTLALPSQWKDIVYEKSNPRKGFVIRDEVGPLEDDEIEDLYLKSKSEEVVPIPKEQEERLYELLDYLKANSINALFIVSPYHMTDDQMEMFNYIKPIIEGYGFRFDNMNEEYDELSVDFKSDYYDYGGHVNTKGAIKCTNHLISLLKEYNLPSHKGESGYESFEDAALLFRQESKEALEKIEYEVKNGIYAEK